MRKVVVYELISLDGVAEDPDNFITEWDDVMDANLAKVIGSQDAVIMGRRSYDEWSRYWPSSDMQPFSNFINNVQKYVATSSALDSEWNKTEVIAGDMSDFVRKLKNQSGGDIGVHASISVAQSLLRTGVVDELRLVIAPRISSAGRKLFDDFPATHTPLIRWEFSPTG